MNKQLSLNTSVREYIVKYLRTQSVRIHHIVFATPTLQNFIQEREAIAFYYVFSGAMTLKLNGKIHNLQQGELMLFPRVMEHTISDQIEGAKTQAIYGVITYDKLVLENLKVIFHQYLKIDISRAELSDVLGGLFKVIACQSKSFLEKSDILSPKIFDAIIATLVNSTFSTKITEKRITPLAINDERINRILHLIYKDPGNHWTISQFSVLAGMSRTSFIQKFKQELGITPIEYLLKHRMVIAFSKLKYNKDKVISVAYSVGYKSETAFSRAFKRTYGFSPIDVINGKKAMNKLSAINV